MKWLFVRRLRSFVLLAAAASFVLNIALLMPAIYMMQVFDRVFTSSSVETLVMLGADHAAVPRAGLLHGHRPHARARLGGALPRSQARAGGDPQLAARSCRGTGPRRHRRAARHRAAAHVPERTWRARAVRCALGYALPRCSSRSCIRCSGSPRRSAALALVALGVVTDRLTRELPGRRCARRAHRRGPPRSSRAMPKSSSAWA